ncbi:hypothetical protein A0J48_021510, partial [Sphaerospermopsis aphanizomenoides BCCUSP55]|uniref:hypothetical protein n=1 Tax=Sphaerospermopsis aphanizomenoides TaxID=459663 RepID=UPI001904D6ED
MKKADVVKLEDLEKRFQEKKKDIEAVSTQISETQDAETKNQLERKLNRLYEELAKIEQDIEKLKSSTNINRNLTKDIDPLLPYLANRSLQEFELKEAIENRDSSRLLVCIIHGHEFQSHYKFLERMQTDFLPHLLDLNQKKTTVKIKKMTYSSELKNLNELPKYLLMNLAKTFVIKSNVSLEEINKNLNKYSPVIIHTDLITDDWQKQGFVILNKLLEFWQDVHNKNT